MIPKDLERTVASLLQQGYVCYCHDCLVYYKRHRDKCGQCGKPISDIRIGYDPKPLEKRRRFGLFHPADLPKGQSAMPIEEDE